MKIAVHTQTEEVAGRRGATSAQPRHASADLTPELYSSRRPHPNPGISATGTNGAPHEGLLFAPLSARFQRQKTFVGETLLELRNSR